MNKIYNLFSDYKLFPKNSGIYKITTISNGKSYIGSALSIKKRMKDYRNTLKNNNCHIHHMQRLFNKYKNKSDFWVEFPIVHRNIYKLNSEAHKELLKEEKFFIQNFDPNYNIIKDPTTQINNPCTSKKVYQYSLDGDYLKEWNSTKEVIRELNIQPQNGLRKLGKFSRSSGGFQWSYTKVIKMPKYKSGSGSALSNKRSRKRQNQIKAS